MSTVAATKKSNKKWAFLTNVKFKSKGKIVLTYNWLNICTGVESVTKKQVVFRKGGEGVVQWPVNSFLCLSVCGFYLDKGRT